MPINICWTEFILFGEAMNVYCMMHHLDQIIYNYVLIWFLENHLRVLSYLESGEAMNMDACTSWRILCLDSELLGLEGRSVEVQCNI